MQVPTDPDVDLHDPRQRRELTPTLLAVIALGGALGAVTRYGLAEAIPDGPFAIWVVNVSGCLLIGVLMVFVTDVWPAQRYVRPFLGVGFLGGYTTFSTAMVDVRDLTEAGRAGLGLLYLGGTVLAAVVAVAVGWYATRALVVRRQAAAR
ncbi:fluoride efflux transporter FluC [Actinophytocola oryzae]|uniref:Fluoride-specific ion channel FluC n=1 Tax=Actinophytocola oryzae TaxID=502181 RepID=A0A4R7V8I0_9PSEU|nr:CrcB family protein [Actinophytocola oryzae]TDV44846.1 CrcB protein [Actinophytocola oryzae]